MATKERVSEHLKQLMRSHSQKTTSSSAVGLTTTCQDIQNEIDENNNLLEDWQDKLDILLSDTNSNLSDIQTIRGIVDDLNKKTLKSKAEQRKNNCPQIENAETLDDNQTIISTSSVRRKDRFALALPDNTNTNTNTNIS